MCVFFKLWLSKVNVQRNLFSIFTLQRNRHWLKFIVKYTGILIAFLMSLFRHVQKMLEKHQSAPTFNKIHAYLSKIQVHRNSFVWRNGFHYSPHPIEQHFMKFKWSFFFNYKEQCLAVIEPNHADLSIFEWFSSTSFFFFIKVFGYVIFVHEYWVGNN